MKWVLYKQFSKLSRVCTTCKISQTLNCPVKSFLLEKSDALTVKGGGSENIWRPGQFLWAASENTKLTGICEIKQDCKSEEQELVTYRGPIATCCSTTANSNMTRSLFSSDVWVWNHTELFLWSCLVIGLPQTAADQSPPICGHPESVSVSTYSDFNPKLRAINKITSISRSRVFLWPRVLSHESSGVMTLDSRGW